MIPTISIDFSPLVEFFYSFGRMSLLESFWTIFLYGGWIIILYFILWGLHELWLFYVTNKFASKQKMVVLAVDIPRENEQTPKAFENIFNQLAGAHSSVWWWDLYKEGKYQQTISLELVSIDGYVQFIFRANENYRDLIEAAVFAQYPEAEITEIADYTKDLPTNFPDDTWNLWGVEFTLVKPEAYPIKVYRNFIDEATSDFKDPMAAFTEVMSKIGRGEQIWLQFVLTPISQKWVSIGEEEVNNILGKKSAPKDNILDKVVKGLVNLIVYFGDEVFGRERSDYAPGTGDGGSDGRKMVDLRPDEVSRIQYVTQKCSKIGFKTKMRLIYVAKHEVFSKPRVIQPMIGAIKQFNTDDANAIKPDMKKTATGGDFFFKFNKRRHVAKRQYQIMQAYKWRASGMGTEPFILNSEELASLYHFPIREVNARALKQSGATTKEPPTNLPNEAMQEELDQQYQSSVEQEANPAPVDVPEQKEYFDLNNDYFEKRFALDNDEEQGDKK